METQAGKGISKFPNTYTLTDHSSQNDGITYYRLTQYNVFGEIVFTETKKVNRVIEPQFEISVVPNPVNEQTIVSIDNTLGEEIQIGIYDLTGKLVYEQKLISDFGNQEISLPFSHLNSGIYILNVSSGNHIVNTKISKL